MGKKFKMWESRSSQADFTTVSDPFSNYPSGVRRNVCFTVFRVRKTKTENTPLDRFLRTILEISTDGTTRISYYFGWPRTRWWRIFSFPPSDAERPLFRYFRLPGARAVRKTDSSTRRNTIAAFRPNQPYSTFFFFFILGPHTYFCHETSDWEGEG